MPRLLIVYGTREGHTLTLARRVAEMARREGHEAAWLAARDRPSPAGYDAVIVAAPVHRLRHPPEVIRWVRENLSALGPLPGAFFSVSLAAALPGEDRQEEARANIDEFVRQTGWRPDMTRAVAGAVAYTRYGFFTRLGMRLAARRDGLDTDTSRNHVYTDWDALRHDVEEFLARAEPGAAEGGARPALTAAA